MSKLIGTAGHVDHGKTTLIKALTGIDADRLPDEKRRGMTIEIGFAYLDLPIHGRVSLVDVPGHERFVRNMLVGALGVDVALLCVAADDAVMPQTREHLQILELLPVERLVVALTRCDLADDETRELAKADVEDLLEKSRFRGARILETSATTGSGLTELRTALDDELSQSRTEKPLEAPWYLPIDRAFSVKGHGVVVTGTMAQGTVKVGDTAFLEPGHREVRVRGIQIHGDAAPRSEAGKRTALNISGVRQEEVERGMSIGAPGALFESSICEARLHWIGEVTHGMRVRISLGAEEAIGKVFLNDQNPDTAQLRLERSVPIAADQPIIIRRYSPPDLLGGGRVTVPQARRLRRGEKSDAVQASNPQDAICEIVAGERSGVTTEEICRRMGKTAQALGAHFESLLKGGRVLGFAGLWFEPSTYRAAVSELLTALRQVHQENPTFAMLPRERAVSAAKLTWTGKPLDRIIADLAAQGALVASGTSVRLRDFRPELPPRQRQLLDRVIAELEVEMINVPNPHQLSQKLGVPAQAIEEILKLGQNAGELHFLGEGHFYTPKQLDAIKVRLREVTKGRSFAAGELREQLGTTRKFIIPILEHFDAVGFTMRRGDERVIRG